MMAQKPKMMFDALCKVLPQFRGLPLLSVLLIGILASPLLVAQSDVAGASDYPGINRFPGATIVDYRQDSSTVYNLALGRMQRAAGRVAASESERFQGHLRRITYAIPDGFSATEVYEHYRAQLLTPGQRELFACQGRGCGSSNFWANDLFNNRILYGPEAGQYYLASTYRAERAGGEVTGYAALYVITRANRRMYAHLDILELSAAQAAEQQAAIFSTPEAMLLRLQQDSAVVVPGLSFDDDDNLLADEGLALLLAVLQRESMLEVYIVGHARGDAPLPELLARSERRAQSVVRKLVDEGITPSRLEAQGIGPLAPYCRPGPCSQRIEVVLR
jgi:outer membrane protein OmpA-like peptidoglycan-associated protein